MTSSRPRSRGVSASERRSPSVSRRGGNAWRAKRSGPSGLCFAQAHRADQRRPQEPRLRFSSRSRSHQGEGPRALARHRQQSHDRPTLEGQCLARSLRGRAAPKQRLTRIGFIHHAGHSSMTAPRSPLSTEKIDCFTRSQAGMTRPSGSAFRERFARSIPKIAR
jgi:hypothetical protein